MAATDVKKKDPVLSWGICVTCYRYASDYVQILGEVKERNFPRFKIVAIFIAPFRQRISRRKLEPALEKNQLCLISTKKIVCGVRYLVYISFFDYFNFPFCFLAPVRLQMSLSFADEINQRLIDIPPVGIHTRNLL